MRRRRNPPYAPEHLERKLSPSGLAPVPAEVFDPGDPPVSDPIIPIGPDGPAFSPDAALPLARFAPVALDPGDPPVSDPIIPIGPDGPA
jgi:hypothetical protein